MIATTEDPRAAELLRRRAEKNGTAIPKSPEPELAVAPEPRKLDEAGKAEIRRLATEHPKWSTSDLADAFEGEYGWRPTSQGIGRTLSDPASPKTTGRRSSPEPTASNPDAEVAAIAALSRALAPLSPGEVRRVLAWARDRFEAGEGGET